MYSSSQGCRTATGTHMPHGITQCYLPPGRGDIPALNPAEAGTRLSDPGGMQSWVDPIFWRRNFVSGSYSVQVLLCVQMTSWRRTADRWTIRRHSPTRGPWMPTVASTPRSVLQNTRDLIDRPIDWQLVQWLLGLARPTLPPSPSGTGNEYRPLALSFYA